jgi:hypothetical protein
VAFAHFTSYTVKPGQVSGGPHGSFPLLIGDQDARYKIVGSGGHVQSAAGFDLRPYNGLAGTALPFELESGSYNSATGAIVVWASVASLADGSAVYLYYGDATITTDGSTTTPWDNAGYAGAYHGIVSGGAVLNATAQGSWYLVNAGSSPNVPGKIGVGIDTTDPGYSDTFGKFFRTTDPGFYDFTSNNFTIAFWWKPSSLNNASGAEMPVFKGGYQSEGYYVVVNNDGSMSFTTNQPGIQQASGTAAGVAVVGSWVRLAFLRNGSSIRILANGVDVTAVAGTHVNPQASNFFFDFGIYNNGGATTYSAPGIYDEMYVAYTNQTPGWMTTEYRNQNAPLTFLTRSGEDGGGSSVPDNNGFLNF